MKGQWGKLTGYFLGTLLVSAAVVYGLPLIGGGSWLPDLISTEGDAIDRLFWGLVALSLVIFAVVGAVVLYSITHFRAEPGDMSDGEHIHGNAKMELVWIVVPSIIVFIVGVMSYLVLEENEIGLYDKAAAKDDGAATMQVDVRGFQFGWEFRYRDNEGDVILGEGGEDDPGAGELVLPVNETVKFNVLACSGREALGRIRRETERELDSHGGHESEFGTIDEGICEREWDSTTEDDRSGAEQEQRDLHAAQEARGNGDDLSAEQEALLEDAPDNKGDDQHIEVNHAFWVPEARLKIDAVAGLLTYVQWEANEVTGPDEDYDVVCAELCGSGHNGMRTEMCVVSEATWDWFLGLDAEERRDATCLNLRLLTCFEDADPDDLMEPLNELTTKDPEATCDEAEEAAA